MLIRSVERSKDTPKEARISLSTPVRHIPFFRVQYAERHHEVLRTLRSDLHHHLSIVEGASMGKVQRKRNADSQAGISMRGDTKTCLCSEAVISGKGVLKGVDFQPMHGKS